MPALRLAFARLAPAALLLAAAGCAPPPSAATDAAALMPGSEWRVTAIDGRPVPAGAAPTLKPGHGGEISGSTGCNLYSGSFRVMGSSVKIGSLTATEMACAPAAMATEATFRAAIAQVDGLGRRASGGLVLTEGGRPRIDLVPAGAAAPGDVDTLLPSGGSWAITRVGDAPSQGGPTFRRDGNQVGGSDGCNTWGGRLVARGTRLDITDMTSTLLACADRGMMEASARVADALVRADGVAGTAGGTVQLTAGGAPVLTLTPSR